MQPLWLSNTGRKLLDILRRSRDVVSGEAVCERLGVTRTAVWKQVSRLQSLGYQIESTPRRGYRLVSSPDLPASWEVEPFLHTVRFGRPLFFFPEVDSTNDVARELAAAGASEGTTVSTDYQKSGRGRRGRSWVSPPGTSLCFSMILRPPIIPAEAVQIELLASLALAAAIDAVVPEVNPRVKWPNDLFVKDKKVAGLLCEMNAEPAQVHFIVLGIGVNVNLTREEIPEEIAENATSLFIESDRRIARPRLLAEFLNVWEEYYWHRWRRNGLRSFVGEWRRRSLLLNTVVQVECGNERCTGVVVGLTERGELILSMQGGNTRTIAAGEVTIGSARVSKAIREETGQAAD